MAGLDRARVPRARGVLGSLEEGTQAEGVPLGGRTDSPQLGLFSPQAEATGEKHGGDALRERLRTLEVDQMTPIEALNALAELVEHAG